MRADRARAAANAWLERLGLGERSDEKLVALSHGNQQRVQFAVALVHGPDLLVLDEPFAGLDPEAVDSLSEVLRERALDGTAILFSSHQLELVERICGRVVIVEAGRALADECLPTCAGACPRNCGSRPALARLGRLAAGSAGSVGRREWCAAGRRAGHRLEQILRAAQAAGPVEHFAFETAGLVDLYRRMLRDEFPDAA